MSAQALLEEGIRARNVMMQGTHGNTWPFPLQKWKSFPSRNNNSYKRNNRTFKLTSNSCKHVNKIKWSLIYFNSSWWTGLVEKLSPNVGVWTPKTLHYTSKYIIMFCNESKFKNFFQLSRFGFSLMPGLLWYGTVSLSYNLYK